MGGCCHPRRTPIMTRPYRTYWYGRMPQVLPLLHPKDRPGLGPVLLEAVIVAFWGREDVDDDRPEVDEDPVRRGRALASDRLLLLVAQRGDDAVGDRIELPFGAAGADHEVVRQRRQGR